MSDELTDLGLTRYEARALSARRTGYERIEQTGTRLVDALVPLWTSGRGETHPLDYVDVIRDPGALRTCFEEMQSGAEHQLLTLSKVPYLVADNPVGLRAARRLARTGGDVRCVYDDFEGALDGRTRVSAPSR